MPAADKSVFRFHTGRLCRHLNRCLFRRGNDSILGNFLVCSAKSCEVFQENSHHFRSSQVNLLTGSDLKANDKNFNGRTISTKTAATQHHHEPVFFFPMLLFFLEKNI